MKLTGGCLCGAVRYEFDGDPRMVFLCHCGDCRRHGGSLLHYGILVAAEALTIEGELKAYESKADSGRSITRKFCPTCGTGVANTMQLAPGMVSLKGGTLDERGPAPTFEVYTESKTPWLSNAVELSGFEQHATVSSKALAWKHRSGGFAQPTRRRDD